MDIKFVLSLISVLHLVMEVRVASCYTSLSSFQFDLSIGTNKTIV